MAIADQPPPNVTTPSAREHRGMHDYRTLKLMHVHGAEHVPMEERSHHDPADHDPERSWREGARIFRCSTCDEEVVVLPPDNDAPGLEQT
jgi:hypothetical protein